MSGMSNPRESDAAWYNRYRGLQVKLALIAAAIALIIGSVLWVKDRLLAISPGKGVPLGSCVLTGTHIATLIQRLEPYVPSLHHDPSTDRYSVSLLLMPVKGGNGQVVPITGGLIANNFQLSRIMGSDGRTLWLEVNGLYGVTLDDHKIINDTELKHANPALDPMLFDDPRGMEVNDGRLHLMSSDRSRAFDIDPSTLKAIPAAPRPSARSRTDPAISEYMGAGYLASSRAWLGLHSTHELDGSFKPGRWLRRVESADDAKQERQLCRGELEPHSDDDLHRIVSMRPVSDLTYLNAAFLRVSRKEEPLRLHDPEGALMIHTSKPGLSGTLIVSRVDEEGGIKWTSDTGIDRFHLTQVLPSDSYTAFVGTRIPVPDKVSEPIVVIIDHATGAISTHSLWR